MPTPQQREEAIFAAALERPLAERVAFLDGACHGDPALRQRLEALLAAHEQSDSLPSPPAEAAQPTLKLEPVDEALGQRIGRYKLLEKIGEGGCGVVYVAEQTEPVRRRVALKLVKLGMDTKQVIARFEAERQALALMDHPNIAQVFDAGTTESSRPFFVMELVRGIKITNHCDRNKLNTKERLNLFIRVYHAVQRAHQKGIIHRDLKPSNVLVTLHNGALEEGRPRDALKAFENELKCYPKNIQIEKTRLRPFSCVNKDAAQIGNGQSLRNRPYRKILWHRLTIIYMWGTLSLA